MRRLLGILVVVVMLAALIIGCTPAVEPSPTPSPSPSPTPTTLPTQVVKIAGLWDLSGPYAVTGQGIFSGFNDYIKYINESGGLDGVEIEHSWVDHGCKVPDAVSAYKRLRDQGIVQVNCLTSVETVAISHMATEDHIPIVSTSASKALFPSDTWLYTHSLTTTDEMGAALKWIHESDWDYEKRARAPRIAFIGWDNPFGRSPVPGATRYAKELGMDVVGDEYFSYGALDLTAPLRRIKDAGADYVFITALNGGISVPMKDGARIGLWEQAKAISNHGMIGNVALVGEVANDVLLATHTMALASEDSLAREIYQKYHPDGDLAKEADYFVGMNHAMASVEGIRLALEKVGFDNLDGTAVKEQGLDKIEFFDTSGVSGGISFTIDPLWHVGGHKIRMVITADAANAKVRVLTDWIDVPIPSIVP